ncbi:hypothetical protein OAD09_02080 [Gammaproteobacteria bacterium]|nr:hypothetical protein [Gammaproteobacteria bacterium]MDB9859525.1 hypothetical protein [Gammaproteobacteria bacterium]
MNSKIFKQSIFLSIFLLLGYIFFSSSPSLALKNKIVVFLKQGQITRSNIPACSIQHIDSIPSESSLIVGHAYGKPGSNHKYLDPKLQNLILQNQRKIKNLIFTGDVFRMPSHESWQFLKKLSEDLEINIYIAPGNHDVGFGDNTERAIFNKAFQNNYPILLNLHNSVIIIDDTTILPWNFQFETFELARKNSDIDKNLILLGHHIVMKELSIFANSSDHRPNNIKSIENFLADLGNLYKRIYIINGDTGAHKFLPSLSCIHSGNASHIVNGLGGKDIDEILVLSNEDIFRFKVNQIAD